MLVSNLDQQRILIIGEDALFREGVIRLLKLRTDYLLSSAQFSDDLIFLDTIKQELPDVVLVCESGAVDTARIIASISSQLITLVFLIVVIRLNDNVIAVYEASKNIANKPHFNSKQIVPKSEADLLNILRRKHHDSRRSRT